MQSPTERVVRDAILTLLPHGHPTIQQVARAVGTSVRTLQRRLATAGLSHSQLVDEVRYAEACRRLDDSVVRVQDIGRALGFGDPGAFTRAFVRWSGVSPRTYRSRLQHRHASASETVGGGSSLAPSS